MNDNKEEKLDYYENTPILCQYCGRESGWTEESIMFLVIYQDLPCKNCGKIVIPAPKTIYNIITEPE